MRHRSCLEVYARLFQLLEHDVIQPYDVKVDRIYNLASPASPPHYQRDPVRTTI